MVQRAGSWNLVQRRRLFFTTQLSLEGIGYLGVYVPSRSYLDITYTSKLLAWVVSAALSLRTLGIAIISKIWTSNQRVAYNIAMKPNKHLSLLCFLNTCFFFPPLPSPLTFSPLLCHSPTSSPFTFSCSLSPSTPLSGKQPVVLKNHPWWCLRDHMNFWRIKTI